MSARPLPKSHGNRPDRAGPRWAYPIQSTPAPPSWMDGYTDEEVRSPECTTVERADPSSYNPSSESRLSVCSRNISPHHKGDRAWDTIAAASVRTARMK